VREVFAGVLGTMKIALLANPSNRYTESVRSMLELGNSVDLINFKPTPELLEGYDLGISWFYRYILKPDQIAAVRLGIINHHVGFLEWGRGACPNVWSIIRGEPAGVTIHWIDAGIDTGDILFQRKVEKYITDTGETLYNRLVDNMWLLFQEKWGYIQDFLRADLPSAIPTRQQASNWTANRMRDLDDIDDLEARFGESLVHRITETLRARTFAGHEAAYIRDDQGRKVYVRVNLSYE
jgi:methionyl-tRNA formyltransferase